MEDTNKENLKKVDIHTPVVEVKQTVTEAHRGGESLSPDTTAEEDTVTAGQRKINLIWERTQSQIAKATIYSNLSLNIIVVILLLAYRSEINKEVIIIIMSCLSSMTGIAGIIIGFYFSRTNHSAIGGVGKKEIPTDKGTR